MLIQGDGECFSQTNCELHNNSYQVIKVLRIFSAGLHSAWFICIMKAGSVLFVFVRREAIVKKKKNMCLFSNTNYFIYLKTNKFCRGKIRIRLEMSRKIVFKNEYKPFSNSKPGSFARNWLAFLNQA